MINLIKKYNVFLKYFFSAGVSFLLDQALFSVFNGLFEGFIGDLAIIVASVLSRVISSFFNYYINKSLVFEKKGTNTLIKYFSLVVIQLALSTASVFIIHSITKIKSEYIKFFVDIIIFVINYIVQKYIIFVSKEK